VFTLNTWRDPRPWKSQDLSRSVGGVELGPGRIHPPPFHPLRYNVIEGKKPETHS
jgi:hypothetical protein